MNHLKGMGHGVFGLYSFLRLTVRIIFIKLVLLD